ncbi:MAG TPA: RluA family pseudouridine synthase [Lutibacter sp.]|nr:RluA family pseudouridine synthase [Lutibacter sp.]
MDNKEFDPQEGFEHYRFMASEGQEPLRVDKFLMNFIENATRNKIQQAAKTGHILVNGNSVKSNYKVKPHDEVRVVLDQPPRDTTLLPEDIPLDIVFEDDDVIIINKPAGLVVHPGHGNYTGTLVNGLLHHIKNLPTNSNERPGLVHRIDKDTSGLLVIAKSEIAMTKLSEQFFDRTTERLYYALVWGNLEEDKGTITGNIGRSLKNRLIMDVFPEGDFGKHAVTHYRVIERFLYVTLVQCKLETGRTHQIRAHFKHIGHPLFNDERYGGDRILKGTTFTKYRQFVQNCFKVIPRQALHAKTLGFTHPLSGEKMSFNTELPDDFEAVITKWRAYTHSHKN